MKLPSPDKIFEQMLMGTINEMSRDEALTEQQFEEAAEQLRATVFPDALQDLTDETFAQIKRRLRSRITLQMEAGEIVYNSKSDHRPWVASAQKKTDFFFWDRYREYLLQEKFWTTGMVNSLDRTTNQILDWLGDPTQPQPFQQRGLILGEVQSGKTAQYTGLINKAADHGYKAVVVLTGTTEGLREQTQRRLDTEFAGRISGHLLDAVRQYTVGVGRYNGIRPERHVAAYTDSDWDFNKRVQQIDMRLQASSDPVLFVMKKNSRVLKSFNNWLERTGTVDPQSGQVRDVPLLLIDDEADNASINTNAEDTDPTAINAEIRTILNRFSQASYVGITATPYANVFIMPNTDDEMFGEDLFPKDFIYTVSAPSNYFGAGRVFGEENDGGSTVELLDGDDMERYFPYKHKIDLVVEELPDSMKEAAAYFILANVIRDIRGDNTQHRSMLVHVSRFTRVQNQVAERLDDWLKQVQSDIRNFARLPAPERDKNITLRYLRFIWDKYKLEQLTSVGDGEVISWDEIAAQYLHSAAAPIMVQTVNRDSGQTGLDYSGYEKEGMRVIAIGGNSLSRGLTLEGLMVSYFYRRPLAADTLMQMGRWFGYRTNYEDLPKLWMSQDAVDWFGYLTRMDQELRFQIRNMVAANKTPRQFALAVRRDPSSLMLTAANKSRNAVDVFRPVVVTGRLLETARLRADPDTLRHNADAVKRFLKKLGSVEGNRDYSVPGYYWRNVSKEAVAELIRSFDTHPWHLSFQGPELASYVENGNAGQWWDVAFILPKDGQGVEYPDVLEHGEGVFEAISKTAKRKFIVNGDVLGVSGTKLRVGSAGAAKIGLTPAEIETAEKRFRSGNSKEHIPDSAYLIESRNPLLMIHLMHMVPDGSAAEEVAKRIPAHLFGLGLGFPMQDGEASVKTALYSVNAAQAGLFQDSSGEDI